MSFSFNFGGDAYSDDEDEDEAARLATLSLEPTVAEHSKEEAAPAQAHDLERLLRSLPLSLAYSTIALSGDVSIPRRELWDIKHQLMSGTDAVGSRPTDSPTHTETSEGDGKERALTDEEVMAFMGADDVIKGVYEGGFKTWECSLDLATFLCPASSTSSSSSSSLTESVSIDWNTVSRVVEFGCGTALPALLVLTRALRERRPLTLLVQDYNLPVLQLSTLPNLFLAWARWRSVRDGNAWEMEDDYRVTEEARVLFREDLSACGIRVECLTGSWGTDMARLTGKVDLVLASETIYATHNLAAFTHLIRTCLAENGTALIAAKSVYFGVGGGVEEFTRELARQDMRGEHVFTSTDGVRRTIMAVKK